MAARLLPPVPAGCRRIVVSGLPRSGTSWIARVLSLSPGVSYYFEPDHLLDARYRYRYLSRSAHDGGLAKHLEAAFAGQLAHHYVIAEQGWKELLGRSHSHTVLLKWVHLVLALDWVAQQLPEIVVIQTVRHPVPLALSWQARGWEFRYALRQLTRQEDLMRGPLEPFQDVLNGARTYWEQVGAFWGAVTYLQWRFHRKGWILREHEWYCLHPLSRFKDVADLLGLAWSDQMTAFLTDPDRPAGPGYGRPRNPRSEIHKWEGTLSPRELGELRAVVARFDLPFYRDLDPEAHWSGG
ncbi:hypothetical protein DEM34_15195 [Spiribacter halobius]|uniref:Sulfotransferase family protein n=2 Tax=Sediminicurvatus halobius TaxID=2182432 RepID=A0A2U2MYC3_9GAMM|nr:hypothetical protein DEM34_15195 [Spiribacter halobius]